MNNKIDINEYIVINNDETLLTEAFQKAIDDTSSKNDILYISKGKYVISTLHLKNNTHIVLDEEAFVLGSLNFYDFERDEKLEYPLYQDQSHSFFDCSMFVGKNVENIIFEGSGTIDMRSVWDLDNIRGIVHRGAKTFALKECKNVRIEGLTILNSTDLCIYYAGCENVDIFNNKLRVYIDGVSPDCSKNSRIIGNEIESGDDGIVFKSSYTLNKLGITENILVKNNVMKSRCNAIKFGTESNGGFRNIEILSNKVEAARITGVSIETVDGAFIDNIHIDGLDMKNVNAPLFIHIGNRMRGPKGLKIGSIKNITLENIRSTGPYEPYEIIPWNYASYEKNDVIQYPWNFDSRSDLSNEEDFTCWQFSSNICGLTGGYDLENIRLKNVYFELYGGKCNYIKEVPEEPKPYPEVFTYGKHLPSKGIYFRHINGLKLENVCIKTIYDDERPDFIFDDCKNLERY